MAETPYRPSSRDELLRELHRLEKESNQLITGLVKQVADDNSVANLVEHKLRTSGAEPAPLEILPLMGSTPDAQRAEMRKVLLAGNAPVAYTVIAVLNGGTVNDEDILLYRPDGGAWARGLVQATAGLREAIVAVAMQEWDWFGRQEVDVTGHKSLPGKQEDSDDGSERVALYWREGVGEPGITGKDRNQYWSAAFISYVMFKAGASALFRRSDHHQEYIYAAMVAARDKRNDYGYWGARLEDHAPELGDLICAWREERVTYEDAQKPGSYASHCDLVVAKTEDTVTVIGGNVSQSVTRRTFRLENGKVTPNTYPQAFAILENRMPAAAESVVTTQLLDHVAIGPASNRL